MLWVVVAVVAVAAWKLSKGRKAVTISAAVVAAAIVYALGAPATLSATTSDNPTTQQSDH